MGGFPPSSYGVRPFKYIPGDAPFTRHCEETMLLCSARVCVPRYQFQSCSNCEVQHSYILPLLQTISSVFGPAGGFGVIQFSPCALTYFPRSVCTEHRTKERAVCVCVCVRVHVCVCACACVCVCVCACVGGIPY